MLMVLFLRLQSFFKYSPKRQHFFERVIESESPNETKKKLKDLCKTRWVQRIDSYTVFYDLYRYIIQIMESISMCGFEYGQWSWDTETMTKVSPSVS